jgi:hypothetical protein
VADISNSLIFETYLNLVNKMWLFESNSPIDVYVYLYNHADDDTLSIQGDSHW